MWSTLDLLVNLKYELVQSHSGPLSLHNAEPVQADVVALERQGAKTQQLLLVLLPTTQRQANE